MNNVELKKLREMAVSLDICTDRDSEHEVLGKVIDALRKDAGLCPFPTSRLPRYDKEDRTR